MKETVKNEDIHNDGQLSALSRSYERPPEHTGAQNRAMLERPRVSDYLAAGVPLWEAPPGRLKELASQIGNAAFIELISKNAPNTNNVEISGFNTAILNRGWPPGDTPMENHITAGGLFEVSPPDLTGETITASFAPSGLADPGEASSADER